MRTFNKFFVFALAALAVFAFAACSSKTTQTSDDSSYHRTGDKNDADRFLRYKVFAAYDGAGSFDSKYALAKIVKGADNKGYYTVKFTTGPNAGEVKKVQDVILRTQSINPKTLKRGQVVMYDHSNPKQFKDSTLNRFEKAVVYDERTAADGTVTLEFPHDKNDFMATRETGYTQNVRAITDPVIRDPRNFLP